ncbi:uncharacterized protein LOC128163286 [Crassostrea angulata]|uniref:uncharacterized protein LOC128163286 n=1 Tax=Magallana angulata TaxID=2784310 RepID=UPI0022B08A70|nr:uncharacterized protein LOC128163286 [Crassostrea angulata]
MSSFACWLCPEKFKSNRDRKNHLISRPHERMRVLCPFCPLRDGKKEKSLRRMSDLKVHIADSHKAEKRISSDSLPSDFFSEANGFWLAVHPKDYLKLITPNSWRADAAVRARTEMIRWIRVNQLSKRRLQELEQGWEAARAPSLTPEEKFVPDYSEEPEEDLQARKRAREYSPSRPDLTSDFQLKTISLEGGVISVYITKEDEVYNVTLTPEAARNPQLLSSFMRKSQTLTHDPFFQTPPTMTPVTSPSIKKVLSIVLAVGPEHFQSIRNGTCPPAYVPSKMSSACHPQDPSPIPGQPESSTIPCQLQDLFSIDSQPEGPPTIDSQPEGPPTIDSQPEVPLPMNILLFSQTSQLLPFLWVSEGHLKFLWPRTLLPKTQPALQVDPFWWNWQIQTPWPPSSTYHLFAQEETASEASQPVLFMPIPLLQLSPTLRHPVPPVLTLQEPV